MFCDGHRHICRLGEDGFVLECSDDNGAPLFEVWLCDVNAKLFCESGGGEDPPQLLVQKVAVEVSCETDRLQNQFVS